LKYLVRYLIVFILFFGISTAKDQTTDEYIKKAGQLQKSGELDKAIEVMTEAVEKYPQSALAHSYCGLYTGMKAGKTKDYMEAFKFVNDSFQRLDKAVSLDSQNPLIRLHRGIMGVSIPEFLGKLDLGITDLEINVRLSKESPQKVGKDILLATYQYLGQGFQKKKQIKKAIAAWKKIVKIAPGSDQAIIAEQNIKKLSEVKPVESTE